MTLVNQKINPNDIILVLGSTGLIGSACVRGLRNKGYNRILSPPRNKLDLTQADAVANYFSNTKFDVVILAAGTVGGILDNINRPFDYVSENLQIFLNVCINANLHDVKKIVLLGSSCMYPLHAQQPMSETVLFSGGLELTSLPYAVSKLASLNFGLSYNKQFDSGKYLAAIPNSTYGPGDNFDGTTGHVLSALLQKFHIAKSDGLANVELWGTGQPRREFVYSDDVADAIIFILENGIETRVTPINIGGGHDIEIAALADMIADVVGFTGNISWDKTKPDGARQKLLDSKIIKSFGWSPKFDLRRGIQLTYSDYCKNK